MESLPARMVASALQSRIAYLTKQLGNLRGWRATRCCQVRTLRPTLPSADFHRTVRMNRLILSHDSVTCGGSPEVSLTAFDTQPPDLPPVLLMDMGFAIMRSLAQHRRPHDPVLVHRLASLLRASFEPRLTTTPLRFAITSPPSGCEEDFHLSKLSDMFGTQKKGHRISPVAQARNERTLA
jgi:hypothetical protein